MVMGRRARYIVLGITLVVIGIGVVCLTLKYGTSSFEKWQSKMALPELKSKPCVFPLQLPTILGATSNLVTGKPGVIKVFVNSEYPIRGYWEERQGYTIGGRSSVSYLIPATRQRGYTSKLNLADNGKYTVILRMRRTPARNGTDNFSLHLMQRTPCNTVIMNFDPLELIGTIVTLPKIIKAPLPTYAVTAGGKLSLKFVAKLRNNTKKTESFRKIFGGTFVRVSWADGEHIRSVHSKAKDNYHADVSTSSGVTTNKNARFVTVRSQIAFKNVNKNNTGLFAVGFILYTSQFTAIKTEVYTDIQAAACSKQPPAIRVESCSDMMSPRIERTKNDGVQELAAVENISNCIRVMTSGNPRPNVSLHALRGREYNKAVVMKPAKSGRPLSGSYIVKTFQIKNPQLDKPEYYLVGAKNDFGESSFTLKIVLYRPVKLLEFYIKGVPRPDSDIAETTVLWYDVPPQTTATLTCKAIGHPLPTIRFFHIPMTTNQTDSVFVLDPLIGDPAWTNLQTINDTVIQTQIDNSTDLVTSSVTLTSGFFIGKTDYIVGCLAENRFFLNRKKIGFHVVDAR
ncbi:uncharacterized protein LOC135499491 [Lineus longissimus]|uniref:uncharacterized protein LOC135499491 n=1 Tax=Lineus longissimus TaxID=88925 RepID=UPI002B4C4699